MNKRGFSLYLTFLVTTIIFILVSGSQQISRVALDMSRSDAIETLVFHAADGGLERGLARLSRNFAPFTLNYSSKQSGNRTMQVAVTADRQKNSINIRSTAILFEGSREVSRRTLARLSVLNQRGRTGSGRFVEAS